jgi:hypothetical protein
VVRQLVHDRRRRSAERQGRIISAAITYAATARESITDAMEFWEPLRLVQRCFGRHRDRVLRYGVSSIPICADNEPLPCSLSSGGDSQHGVLRGIHCGSASASLSISGGVAKIPVDFVPNWFGLCGNLGAFFYPRVPSTAPCLSGTSGLFRGGSDAGWKTPLWPPRLARPCYSWK